MSVHSISHTGFCRVNSWLYVPDPQDSSYQMKDHMNVSMSNSMSAVQGVLQSLTSTVGSAANTVTSTAKSAVNRLTGDGSNGLTTSYGPTVRHNLQQVLQSNAHVLCLVCGIGSWVDAECAGNMCTSLHLIWNACLLTL